ncbi:MAG: SWIM zinc finger family protein, partial [Cytophagales bacterium]|nr:SWIM zinc finger family protein [Cytophagales bacterium]
MTTFHSLKLKKYLLNNTFPDIVARGRKMLGDKMCTLDALDLAGPGKAAFRVRSDSDDKIYRVEISGFQSGTLKSSCTCPYDWGGICKHRVAAIHLLDGKLQQEENAPPKVLFPMADSVAFLPALGDAALRVNCRDEDWKAAAKLPERVVVKQALNGQAECELTYKKTPYTIRLTGKEKDLVHTSCSCNESLLYPLCLHKVAALLKIREQFGIKAFLMMRDWTDDKRRLLAEYGYTLDDDLKGKFDFRVNDRKGELELVLKDPSLHKLDADWQGLGRSLLGQASGPVVTPVVPIAEETLHLIYALEAAGPLGLPGLKLTPLTCKINPKTGKMTHVRQLSQLQGGSLPVVSPEDTRNIRLAGLLTVEGLIKHLQEAGQVPNHGWYGYDFEAKLSEEARTEARRYEGVLLEELFHGMAGKRTYEQARSTYNYSAETLFPMSLSPVRIRPEFVVKEEKDLVSVEMFIRLDDQLVPFSRFGYRSFWVVHHAGALYKFAGLAEANLFRYFSEHGAVRVKKDRLPEFLAGFVLPLAEKCDLDLQLSQPVREADLALTNHRVYLKEDEDFLLLAPAFAYAADGEAVECVPDGRSY